MVTITPTTPSRFDPRFVLAGIIMLAIFTISGWSVAGVAIERADRVAAPVATLCQTGAEPERSALHRAGACDAASQAGAVGPYVNERVQAAGLTPEPLGPDTTPPTVVPTAFRLPSPPVAPLVPTAIPTILPTSLSRPDPQSVMIPPLLVPCPADPPSTTTLPPPPPSTTTLPPPPPSTTTVAPDSTAPSETSTSTPDAPSLTSDPPETTG